MGTKVLLPSKAVEASSGQTPSKRVLWADSLVCPRPHTITIVREGLKTFISWGGGQQLLLGEAKLNASILDGRSFLDLSQEAILMFSKSFLRG